MDYFRQYLIVGGMPQAVKEYAETKDFKKVDIIKRNIIDLYKDDIKKYSDDPVKIERIFNEIPSRIAKPRKKI